MFRLPLAVPQPFTGLLRRIAAVSVIAAALAVPAGSASAAGCLPPSVCTLSAQLQPASQFPLFPQQLIADPSFEDPSHPHWIMAEAVTYTTSHHHSGVSSLELPSFWGAPRGDAYQDVAIPSTASHPVLHSYLNVESTRPGTAAVDSLQVVAAPYTSAAITLARYSNLNNTHGGWCLTPDFDLSAYRGQTVRIMFTGSVIFPALTAFYVDDVELWTYPYPQDTILQFAPPPAC